MIEKIVSFEELKIRDIKFRSEELNGIVEDLKKVGFFSEDIGKTGICCEKVFNILRKTPDNSGKINGQDYIREDYFEDGKFIKAKIYDFDLHVSSTCS
jgi:hypothetical protein